MGTTSEGDVASAVYIARSLIANAIYGPYARRTHACAFGLHDENGGEGMCAGPAATRDGFRSLSPGIAGAGNFVTLSCVGLDQSHST